MVSIVYEGIPRTHNPLVAGSNPAGPISGKPFSYKGPDSAASQRSRSRAGWGLVHFSAVKLLWREKRWPKTWTCPLPAARGGQSHFRGGEAISRCNIFLAAKIGTVPCERLPPQLSMSTEAA